MLICISCDGVGLVKIGGMMQIVQRSSCAEHLELEISPNCVRKFDAIKFKSRQEIL